MIASLAMARAQELADQIKSISGDGSSFRGRAALRQSTRRPFSHARLAKGRGALSGERDQSGRDEGRRSRKRLKGLRHIRR